MQALIALIDVVQFLLLVLVFITLMHKEDRR